jgi:hypothetical protein
MRKVFYFMTEVLDEKHCLLPIVRISLKGIRDIVLKNGANTFYNLFVQMIFICKNLVKSKNNGNLDTNLIQQGKVIGNTNDHSAKN